jgi:hypothetical protein
LAGFHEAWAATGADKPAWLVYKSAWLVQTGLAGSAAVRYRKSFKKL